MLGITDGTNITEIQNKNFINLLGKYFILKLNIRNNTQL